MRDLRYSAMLRSVDWYLFTGVLGQTISPFLKDQSVFMDCLTIKEGKDRLARNVNN
jgi:hypothetical protein